MKITTKMAGLTGFGFAGFLWLGITAAIAASQRKLVFDPAVGRGGIGPRSSGHRTRSVVLRADDGTRLSGWLMTPEFPGPHRAVIYFGGRSEDVSWVARDAGRMFPGMAVLAVNYRGYGESHGVPTEPHMVDDGRVLFDWLVERRHIDPTKVAVVGRSLGSGVAVQVATARPVNSLVLITPYDSILALARRRFRAMPISFVLGPRFETIKYASLLKIPTYVLRAATDVVVPHSHTDVLVATLTHLSLDETISDSDHSNIPHLVTTQDKIANFLTSQFEAPRAQQDEVQAEDLGR